MDITPTEDDLWQGIGGHFDSFSQIMNEFIDNAISNFIKNNPTSRSINITITEQQPDKIEVKVEDTGSGMSDFSHMLRLGDKTMAESPLNEHGFGLKHALAAADIANRNWKIYTRTQTEFRGGKYRVLSAPYKFQMDSVEKEAGRDPWPGVYNGPGTLVQFVCNLDLFYTVRKGVRGPPSFDNCVDYLIEDLGYTYSGMIGEGKASIIVNTKPVPAVIPNIAGFYKPDPGTISKDLGGGTVSIAYKFCEIKESAYLAHYKKNTTTSGVEIRVNGRVIMSNLFKEIWSLEPHPLYNHFLVQVNLISQSLDALPKTRTSKNGIRSGDPKLKKLFEWILEVHPNPEKKLSGAVRETELVAELAQAKDTHIRHPDKHIETGFKVFKTIDTEGVFVDLYVFDGTQVVLYEAKKDKATIQDLYQLRMYWDGAVVDGINPTEGILLASDFSNGVDAVMSNLNATKDANGNNYHFSKKRWNEEGVTYP
jgi:Histidine kinase-, DNA gyrase B-, and HSP90-like ATPase